MGFTCILLTKIFLVDRYWDFHNVSQLDDEDVVLHGVHFFFIYSVRVTFILLMLYLFQAIYMFFYIVYKR